MPKFKRATNNNLLTKVGKAGQVNGFNKNVNIGNSASSVQQDDEIASMSSSAGGDGCLNANFKNGNNNKQLKLKNGGASTSKNILNGSSKNVASKKKKLPKVKRTKASSAVKTAAKNAKKSINQPGSSSSLAKRQLFLSNDLVVKNPAKNGCNGNTIITDYFQLRKSSRRTVAEIKAEQIRKFTDAVVYACEDDLEVREFPIKGRGVIAKRKFAHEEFVVEYRGELIESAEAQRREERYQKNSRIGCYMFYFYFKGKQYCLDATRESVHKGRLLNHSAKGSNLKSKILEVNNRPHVIFLAKRDIEAGEELLYDYGDRRKNAVEANPWLVRS
ncbi:N-lysine methyltransferase SETD8-A [Trichinella pseudospiralis]|uniref:[histone H4]-lysine(20) N-methyltransferase n=1 Tax=Trichinella pseudospiralis TaxID=6337 RepID=A0A0V1IG49_TRIPS|nr:N-lysine methyltransferase SETD8-A [Trichinella pseudospiralis]KRZ21740.1 N-lysine methyltransferase SETD8-A [Trichinella pseudospiralis]